MDTLLTIIKVLRTLIDAAFSGGSINDAQHSTLHGHLNEVDPGVAQARAEAEAGLTPEEQATLDALEAKQAAARQAGQAGQDRQPSQDRQPGQPGTFQVGSTPGQNPQNLHAGGTGTIGVTHG